MARPTWEDALAADGPKVARWMRATIPNLSNDAGAWRRLNDWDRGNRACFYTIDRILTRHGLHASELPANVWVSGSARAANGTCSPREPRQPQEIKPKPCEVCGKTIPLVRNKGTREERKTSPKRYEAAKYCSRECQWQRATPKTRPVMVA